MPHKKEDTSFKKSEDLARRLALRCARPMMEVVEWNETTMMVSQTAILETIMAEVEEREKKKRRRILEVDEEEGQYHGEKKKRRIVEEKEEEVDTDSSNFKN